MRNFHKQHKQTVVIKEPTVVETNRVVEDVNHVHYQSDNIRKSENVQSWIGSWHEYGESPREGEPQVNVRSSILVELLP